MLVRQLGGNMSGITKAITDKVYEEAVEALKESARHGDMKKSKVKCNA